MKIFRRSALLVALLLGSIFTTADLHAQDTQEAASTLPENITLLPPLFEYPVAPEEISDWQERSNWLVEHFWDNFNFKQKAVGQSQLYHAFRTFIVPMRFAAADVVLKSVDKLIAKLKKNPGLLLQFTMAAEKAIYDPVTSDALIDEVYMPFLKAIVADKKLPQIRKVRFEAQYKALQGCLVGDVMKSFDFVDRNGAPIRYNPQAKYTLIEFGDPDCNECQMQRIRIESDDLLQQAMKDGHLEIMFIIPDVDPDEGDSWRNQVDHLPHYWTVGAATDLETMIDLRFSPCLYLIGPDRKIISKNISVKQAHDIIQAALK